MPESRLIGTMNSRLIISLSIAGALAYACGPRSRSSDVTASLTGAPVVRVSADSHAAPSTSRAASPHARRNDTAIAKSDGVRIDSRFEVEVAPKAVHFAFNIKNAGAKHVELNFRNGQSYDFVVIDSAGREIWRWAAGRMFTQTVRNKQLGKGESMRVDESMTQSMPAGRYTAIATLVSSNHPVEQRVEFVVPAVVSVAAAR
jgi:hypothetical protein